MANQPLQYLSSEGIRFLRIAWCDNANVIRAKAVHTGALGDLLRHGVGISRAQQAVHVAQDAFVPESGLGPVGEVRLVPDMETLSEVPFAPGHAKVMGDMRVDGAPWPLCPREFVRRMVEKVAERNLQVQAAFENEFYLLRGGDGPPEPVDRTLFAAVHAMDLNYRFIDELAEALLAQRIPIEQWYPESGFGQQELSISYGPALLAADRQVAYRQTVHAVASHRGLRASFLPKVFPDCAGSGCHVHMSLWRDGENVTSGPQALSLEARAWMAGILAHLPALMALTTPIPNSYRRLAPHCWSGAFACWGFDNREAALRVPTSPEGGGPTNFEIKTVDAASNPYLALGLLMAAGLDGLDRGLELGEPVQVDPGLLPEASRPPRLPQALGEALEHLEKDAVLLGALGPELARAVLAVRRKELEVLGALPVEEEVALLLERY